jgi:hypothetical protein
MNESNGRTSRSVSVSASIRSANASSDRDGLGEEGSIPEGDEDANNEEEELDYLGMDKVESFHRQCCESREDFPHPRISAAVKVGHPSFYPPTHLLSRFSLVSYENFEPRVMNEHELTI